jgi:hypothetical protein
MARLRLCSEAPLSGAAFALGVALAVFTACTNSYSDLDVSGPEGAGGTVNGAGGTASQGGSGDSGATSTGGGTSSGGASSGGASSGGAPQRDASLDATAGGMDASLDGSVSAGGGGSADASPPDAGSAGGGLGAGGVPASGGAASSGGATSAGGAGAGGVVSAGGGGGVAGAASTGGASSKGGSTSTGGGGSGGARPSCASTYGSVTGFTECSETATTCVFGATLGGSNCGALCTSLGRTCVDQNDNGSGPCVVANTSDTCSTNRTDAICECSR